MNKRECCGTCRWHRNESGEWYCDNKSSDYYGLESGYGDSCDDYDGKE